MSLTNDDIVWYDSSLSSLDIIDICGEFSNVPLIDTQGGISYNPALARHHPEVRSHRTHAPLRYRNAPEGKLTGPIVCC